MLLVPFTRRRRAEQLLQSANINAAWGNPPTAEEIRARDQERLMQDPVLAEAPADDDLGLARQLLADHSPEALAAALIRLHRSRLPAPEELFDGRAAEEPRQREARTETSDAMWFRASVGRRNNADPKWLVPLICRLGHVTKKDIGVIRIADRETRFEITREAAPRFIAALKGAGENEIRIEPSAPDHSPRSAPSGFKKPTGFKKRIPPRRNRS